jgi:Site-specific recombinase XerD
VKKNDNFDMDDKEKRKLRSSDLRKVVLGRYPFQGGIKYYVAKKGTYLSTTTIHEDERKLRYFARTFEELKGEGKVKSSDPRYISKEEIGAFFDWMGERGLDVVTREKYLQILERYLKLFGNHVIETIKTEDCVKMPKEAGGKPIRALDQKELQKIFDAAEKIDGWKGTIIRGVIALAFGTGCRPKEIFNAKITDLKLSEEKFYVRHPKGEGSWASPQDIDIIRGDMIPKLEKYLQERKEGLQNAEAESIFLFPNPSTGEPYAPNTIRSIKEKVSKIAGVSFRLKDFRSTLATMLVADDETRIKAVSMQLRHTSMRTTERFYAKIQRSVVKKTLGDVWKENQIF